MLSLGMLCTALSPANEAALDVHGRARAATDSIERARLRLVGARESLERARTERNRAAGVVVERDRGIEVLSQELARELAKELWP